MAKLQDNYKKSCGYLVVSNLQLSCNLITTTLSTRTKTSRFIPVGTVVVNITSKFR